MNTEQKNYSGTKLDKYPMFDRTSGTLKEFSGVVKGAWSFVNSICLSSSLPISKCDYFQGPYRRKE